MPINSPKAALKSLILIYVATMSSKGKQGKERLDKYYYLAKEQGYRARSAFKILQLAKKYNIFENCK